MLSDWSMLDFWVSFVSPVLRTSCPGQLVFQYSWAVAVAIWKLLLNHGVVPSPCAQLCSSRCCLRLSETQQTAEIDMNSSDFLYAIYMCSGSVCFFHFCKHMFRSADFHSLCTHTLGRVFLQFLSKAAYGNTGVPWPLFILANALFQTQSPQSRGCWFQLEDPTQLMLSLWRNVTGVFVTFYSLPRLVI